MLSMDTENPDNGFYAGAKWQQVFTIKSTKKFPFVVLVAATNILLSIGESICLLVRRFCRARVQLFKSNLYVDVNAQPRFLFYSTKQEG